RTPGAHTAETHPTWVPLFSAVFHCGVYIGSLSITPSSTSSPQNRATRCVGSSSIATDQCSPSICHHEAPACCASPTNRPGSALEKVPRNISGSAALIVRAASAQSAQVGGAGSASSSKTAARQ